MALLAGCETPPRAAARDAVTEEAPPEDLGGGVEDATAWRDAEDVWRPPADCHRETAVETRDETRPRAVRATLAAPRPLYPPSVMKVMSQRPTVRWSLPPGVRGARVELCLDCACERVLLRQDVEGESFRPAARLPPGVVFWRLRGITEREVGERLSPTWEFVVGRHDRPTDFAYGGLRDFNGDGYDDALVGIINPPEILVFTGGPGGPSGEPQITLRTQDTLRYRADSLSFGDVNRDGIADVAMTGAAAENRPDGPWHQTSLIYHGLTMGLSPDPTNIIPQHGTEQSFYGYPGTIASDLNGDGFSDLARSDYPPNPEISVYLGGPGGLTWSRAVVFSGNHDDRVGYELVGVGDTNRDGYGDLLGSMWRGDGRSFAKVFYGGPFALGAQPSMLYSPRRGETYGMAIFGQVDWNADGYSDFGVGGESVIDLYRGGPGDPPLPTRTTLVPPPGELGLDFGDNCCGLDFNGDGRLDLAMANGAWPIRDRWADGGVTSEDQYYFGGGALLIFLGTEEGVDRTPALLLEREMGFGWKLACVGDMNGDGRDDVFVMDRTTHTLYFVEGSESVGGATARRVSTFSRPATRLL
ncbi:MAG: VCBS repeat-containing protein [Deltaproteobacteria bacterium]|nr:VCBS repeat-containing protein [Deltaproteobacteria bacterium]